MHKRFLIILLISFHFTLFGNPLSSESFTIVSRTSNEIIIKVTPEAFSLAPVTHGGSPAGFVPHIHKGSFHLEQGLPDLQHLTTSLIREGQEAQVQVLNKKIKTFYDVDILPSRGNLYRNQDLSVIPYKKGARYNEDRFFPSQVASFGDAYHFRDFPGIPLKVTPMQYNPVTREFRLLQEVLLKVTFTNSSPAPKSVTREYKPIYHRHFLNYEPAKYTPVEEKGEMLVFTHADFDQDIRPFVEWKNITGIPTKQIRIDTLGSGSAQDIKSYIAQYYQSNNLAFVLLVGDAHYVPTNTLPTGHSDNAYGYLVGNDSYPEIFVGRFSATQSSHVQTMVDRTIMYEQGLSNTGDWMNTSLGIASDEGPGDNNEMDYEHVRNMHIRMQGYTYIHLLEMFEGSQGGNDAPGDPTASMVFQEVEQGVGNILYTGHGSVSSWHTSGFNNSHVNQLTNTSAWPFIWSVACVNGDFVGNTSFAEHWLRAQHNGVPTGAIAAFMSTINQSWNPPMRAQDEMVDIMIESYANNIKRTYGGISINGCLAMNDAYGSHGDEVTDTWVIFGDPSVMVRTDTPSVLTPSYNPALFPGDTSLQVTCSVENARVALSVNGELLDVQYVQNGTAQLSFPSFLSPDTLLLSVAAYNHHIYMDTVMVLPSNQPYVIFNDVTLWNIQGTALSGAEQGKSYIMDVMLENIGLTSASAVSASILAEDTSVIILQDQAMWGSIASGDTSLRVAAFELEVKAGVKNNHNIPFTLIAQDSTGASWSSTFTIPAAAPDPQAVALEVIRDSAATVANRLEAGEPATLEIRVKNKGDAVYHSAWCTLTPSSTYVTADQPFETITDLYPGQAVNLSFPVSVSPDIPDGTTVIFELDINGGHYSSQKDFYQTIGSINERFDTKDFSSFSWQSVGAIGWKIDTTEYFSAGASAVSGLNYGQHSATSILLLTMNVLKEDSISFYRKVSSEENYDFMKFFINNKLMSQWSGNKDWERFSFPVPQGPVAFKWTYEKDQYVSQGADKAWLDELSLPYISTPASTTRIKRLSSASIFPNPAEDMQHIQFTLDQPAQVKISLQDISGKHIRNIHNNSMEEGTHTIAYPVDNLPQGVYLITLMIGETQQHNFRIIRN